MTTQQTDDDAPWTPSWKPLTPEQRQRITALAADFPALWHNPATPMRERKRMVRLLVTDATLRKSDTISLDSRSGN